MWPSKSITATVLEAEDLFCSRYTGGTENIAALRSTKNASLVFEVDATALPESWRGRFDTIIMNFPHPGGKTNLRRSRLLAKHVFRSVRTIMCSSSRFHLSLAYGQPGFDALAPQWSTSPPPQNPDSWQVLNLAAEEGLLLKETLPMFPVLFPGYRSSGYKTTSKGFNNWKEAVRLVFIKNSQDPDFDKLGTCSWRREDMFYLLRPHFVRDISFLYACDDQMIQQHETDLFRLLHEITGSMVVSVREVKELRSICPDPLLPNRIYRMYWQTLDVPLTRALCNKLDEEMRSRVLENIARLNLPLILT